MIRHMRAILILTISALLLSACGNRWERPEAWTSPDGTLQAIAEYKGSAACCSDHSRLRFVEHAKGTLEENPDVVVEVTGARLKGHWEGNDRLIVEACGATAYEVTSRVLRRGLFQADGLEDAIRIDVISLPATERDGELYCAPNSN